MKFQLAILSFVLLFHGELARDYDTELYTSSIVGMLKLLEIEKQFVENFKKYYDAQEEKLKKLKIYLNFLDRTPLDSKKEQEAFVSNPLQGLSLIRRLRQDWPALQVLTSKDPGSAQLAAMRQLLGKAPSKEDMQETLDNMERIEQFYALKPVDVAAGRLQDKQFSHKLSVRDCVAMGNYKYEKRDYLGALSWYSIALRQKPDLDASRFDKVLGEVKQAVRIKFLKSHLMHFPKNNETSAEKKRELELALDSQLKTTNKTHVNALVDALLNLNDDLLLTDFGAERPAPNPLHLGCNGQFLLQRNLNCRYNSTTTPFLRLAPLKMEEISLDPYIIMFHDVLYDAEIEEMKRLAENNMVNGLSDSIKPNQTETLDIVGRMYQFLKESTFRKRINQRIRDITGFDMREVPGVNTANFGIGSYFRPHLDYEYGTDADTNLGDRSATLLAYASDVPQGGQTIFPDIEVAVHPKKGNALLWYNLFDDDSPDPRTLHAVCPIIVGSRWTLSKWIHSSGQMFIKTCQARPRM